MHILTDKVMIRSILLTKNQHYPQHHCQFTIHDNEVSQIKQSSGLKESRFCANLKPKLQPQSFTQSITLT